jgi:hypothetical protein
MEWTRTETYLNDWPRCLSQDGIVERSDVCRRIAGYYPYGNPCFVQCIRLFH